MDSNQLTKRPEYFMTVVVFLVTYFLTNLILSFFVWLLSYEPSSCQIGCQAHPTKKKIEPKPKSEIKIEKKKEQKQKQTPKANTNMNTKGEVFNVKNTHITYDQAAKICSRYKARLATKAELELAQHSGANWCNLGWVKDGNAYYPTQPEQVQIASQWPEGLKGACGKVGLNGGNYQKSLKLSVNCFGIKPSKTNRLNPWNTLSGRWSK